MSSQRKRRVRQKLRRHYFKNAASRVPRSNFGQRLPFARIHSVCFLPFPCKFPEAECTEMKAAVRDRNFFETHEPVLLTVPSFFAHPRNINTINAVAANLFPFLRGVNYQNAITEPRCVTACFRPSLRLSEFPCSSLFQLRGI